MYALWTISNGDGTAWFVLNLFDVWISLTYVCHSVVLISIVTTSNWQQVIQESSAFC